MPRLVHFIFGLAADFDGKEYGVVQYLAVLAVRTYLPADTRILLHYGHDPEAAPGGNAWWRRTLPLVETRRVRVAHQYAGRPLTSGAQRSDVLRLQLLYRYGGVYLDMDVLVCHPALDDLRHAAAQAPGGVVLGREGDIGLGNAVIVARPGAPFLAQWLYAMRSVPCWHCWNHHSVKLPAALHRQFPHQIHVLPPEALYQPLWDERGLHALFVESSGDDHTVESVERNVSKTVARGTASPLSSMPLVIHLWAQKSHRRFLRHLQWLPASCSPLSATATGGLFFRYARVLLRDARARLPPPFAASARLSMVLPVRPFGAPPPRCRLRSLRPPPPPRCPADGIADETVAPAPRR